mmetsp:Transcript_103686/g.288841  ORF Transcript_103686/g.288841 Transcript_103686/m.288841 type:complete len:378 (+) Transcript_103686:176-1309(+)
MGIHHSHIPHFMAPRHKIPGEFFTAKDVNPDAGTFSPEELVEIERAFLHLAQKHGPGNVITKEDFMERFPLPGALGERLFEACDRDHDGAINLINYISMVRMLTSRRSEEHRLLLLWDMFDVTHKGRVTRKEMRMLLNSAAHAADAILRRYNAKIRAKRERKRAAAEREAERAREEEDAKSKGPGGVLAAGGGRSGRSGRSGSGGGAGGSGDPFTDDFPGMDEAADDDRKSLLRSASDEGIVDPSMIIASFVRDSGLLPDAEGGKDKGKGADGDGKDGGGKDPDRFTSTGVPIPDEEETATVFRNIEETTEIICNDAFSRYDRDKTGYLDYERFCAWAHDTPMMGQFLDVVFGQHGERLFDFSDEEREAAARREEFG